MLSLVKLRSSVSMSGPSATAKPMSPKISATSSNTWLTGWMRPSCSGPSRTGSVTSAFSVARRAVSAPRSSSALRASSASLTRALSPLTAWPKALRWSAGSVPSLAISSGTRPFLPSAAMRTRSMASEVARAADLGEERALRGRRGRWFQPLRAFATSSSRSGTQCHPAMRASAECRDCSTRDLAAAGSRQVAGTTSGHDARTSRRLRAWRRPGRRAP